MATHLVHSNDGAVKTSDWWSQSSWFDDGQQACTSQPVRESLPSGASEHDIHRRPTAVRHAGGAAAQCRFSGRCAIPIGTTAPVDGSPILSQNSQSQSLPAGRLIGGIAVKGSSRFVSRWVFNMDQWKWVPKDALDCSPTYNTAKSQLAAQRWSDKRGKIPAPATSFGALQATREAKRSTAISSDIQEPSGFGAVAGLGQQKAALHSAVVIALRYPQMFGRLGVRPVKVLLHGPPGTGKTAIIPRLAEEARAYLEVVDGAAIQNDAANSLKRAYNRAKANAPAVLFVDSVDALAPARGQGISSEELRSGQAFIALLDSVVPSDRVAVVAATNSRSSVCLSALAPHRLGLEVAFGSPSSAERLEMMRSIMRKAPLDNLDLEAISHRMQGFVAADCQAICTRAVMACISEAVASAEAAVAASSPCGDADGVTMDAALLDEQMVVTAEHFDHALQRAAPSSMRHLAPSVEAPLTSWADIGGQHAVKQALQEMIDMPLRRPLLMEQYGAKPSRGALLYGPPGCGKTLLARAAAAQCGANFICVSGPQLLDKWFGESERAVRDLFAAARAASPSIIFFDELDSLAPKRQSEGSGAGDATAARVLTQLLVEMDGFSASSRVFVLGATNRPEALDPALLRPGRLDALLEVGLPDEHSRLAILKVKLREAPVASNVDLSVLAALCDGMSGADVSELCRCACQLALRSHIQGESAVEGGIPLKASVEACHFEDALATVRRSVLRYESRDIVSRTPPESDEQSSTIVSSQESIDQLHSQWVRSLSASAAANSNEGRHQTAYIAALESALVTAGIELPKC